MTQFCRITLAGKTAELHGSRFLWLPESRLLCASDIHLEKGSFFRRFGTLLPPYDTHDTLEALERGVAQFQPEIFVALGDSFHDVAAHERMEPELLQRLLLLMEKMPRWIWVTGNHDPEVAPAIGGERHGEFTLGNMIFRHEAEGTSHAMEISGHYHPKASTHKLGHFFSAPCFLLGQKRLIMPAFGSFTGGLHVNDAALQKVVPQAQRDIYLAYRNHIHRI